MKFAGLLKLPRRAMPCLAVSAIILGLSGIARADNGCMLQSWTLRGSYIFAAKGYNIVGGVAQPKAIIEVIVFNGDGTLTTPSVSRSGSTIWSTFWPGT